MSKLWLLLFRFGPLVRRLGQSPYRRFTMATLRRAGIVVGTPQWVSPRAYFDIGRPNAITIGDGAVISHDVKLLTHDFSLDRVAVHLGALRAGEEFVRYAPVVIGENAFIGMNAIILPGITVGAGSIVGAGAVVTRDVAENTVVAGNPAREICGTAEYLAKSRGKFIVKNHQR